jgi:outer membrane lipoprotein SlyB
MKFNKAFYVAVLIPFWFLSGCASGGRDQMATQQTPAYGVVEVISTSNANNSGMNAGTVIGGIAGAVVGNQVGGGNGNTLATVAGAVGGAAIGQGIGNNNRDQMYAIQVRLDNGTVETVTQKGDIADLRVGDRVRVEDGQVNRA